MIKVKLGIQITERNRLTPEHSICIDNFEIEAEVNSKFAIMLACMREFGRIQKCWVINGIRVGWIFAKKFKYDDGTLVWQETYVEILEPYIVRGYLVLK